MFSLGQEIVMNFIHVLQRCSEFSAEVAETSVSAEDASLEDRILTPQIGDDMLNHKNPAVTNNELKELWEKLPEYELTDIK